MSTDPLQKNDIISRWKNKQSIRAIARDLGLGRYAVARVVHQHLKQTESADNATDNATDNAAPPASFGNVPLTRKTKLEPFFDQLQQLLERYPKLTALRAFEELRKSGFEGSYSTVRAFVKTHRFKPKAKTVRFETAHNYTLNIWV